MSESHNNNNIKLFHFSAGGGNTCWLQSALVLLQGEDDYITAINNYDEIYKDNINSTNTDEKTESKLMHSIKNFLDNKTEKNLTEISKSYQDYVQNCNKNASDSNQQDTNFSVGSPYDSTTFLGEIENILCYKKIKKATNFPTNRLVLNNGNIIHNQTYNNDTKYIFSYTPGHWVVYKKISNDNYIKYDTCHPLAREQYPQKDILKGTTANTIPSFKSKKNIYFTATTPQIRTQLPTVVGKSPLPKVSNLFKLPMPKHLSHHGSRAKYYRPFGYDNVVPYYKQSLNRSPIQYKHDSKVYYPSNWQYYLRYRKFKKFLQYYRQFYRRYYYPLKNITLHSRYRLPIQYQNSYINFARYQYRPIFNRFATQRYNLLNKVKSIPSIVQPRFFLR